MHEGFVADIIAHKGDETHLIEVKVGMTDIVAVLSQVARLGSLPGISSVSLALARGQFPSVVVEIARRIGVGIYTISESDVRLELEPRKLPRAEISVGASFPTSVAIGRAFDLNLSVTVQNKIATNIAVECLCGGPWYLPDGERARQTIPEIIPNQEVGLRLRIGVGADTRPGKYLLFVKRTADGIDPHVSLYEIEVKSESGETLLADVRKTIASLDEVTITRVRATLERLEAAMLQGVVDIRENVKFRSIWAELGNYCIQNGLYRQAQSTYESMLDTIRKWEQMRNETLHKGLALYNLALALYYQGKISEARERFEQAFVEDRRTFGEAEAQKLPAKQALEKLFAEQ